ncbi:RNA polymerase sigma70 factor [Bacillus coahuilensis p1.1.43]|uniref:RNA polymerase sigma70 factor n=1 Tax=Bacillus coahuilensis p1.1.43 TaxID=1150625 RepID=A0A147K490_9BACI|nr:sigma-70 family RNA polymerase sigma factor [Bacillus coahuilensis]KUP04148.1 RNA polymerase sigma70 factor [Bacillus coahuilensis p1.1.43]
MNELKDEELYDRMREKDKEALSQLYSRYERILYSFIYRLTGDRTVTEETMQELFIKLWRDHAPYETHKGKFSSWLLTLARNQALDAVRKKSRESTYEYHERDDVRNVEETPEDHVEWKEKCAAIRSALSILNQEQKQIVELFYFKGHSQSTIAKETGLPLGTVKGRIRLALQHIKKHLDREGGVLSERT